MRTRLTRTESRERTRAALLRTAEKLFGELGYHGVSLDAIAEQAGYTKGAIYANFDGKEDIFLQLIDRHTQNWKPTDWEAEPRPAPTFGESSEPATDAEETAWTLLSVEFWLTAARSPVLREKLAATYARVRAQLAPQLELDRELSADESAELAVLFLALDLGIAMQSVLDPGAVPPSVHKRAYRMIANQARGVDTDRL